MPLARRRLARRRLARRRLARRRLARRRLARRRLARRRLDGALERLGHRGEDRQGARRTAANGLVHSGRSQNSIAARAAAS